MTKKFTPWRDPSVTYVRKGNFEKILRDIPSGNDGYPGYVVRGHYIKARNRSIGPRFEVGYCPFTLDGLRSDPALYDLPPFGKSVVVVPGYVISDLDYKEGYYMTDKVEDLSFEEDQPPLPFVETLLLPEEMQITILDKNRMLPNLKHILFYKPGRIDPNYEEREVDPELLHLPEATEIHQYDYDYVYLGKGCPYYNEEESKWHEDLPRECVRFSGTVYDIVYHNMIFNYNSETDTAELTHMPTETSGRVIVPDTIGVFGHRVPVVGVSGIYDYRQQECKNITEINVPAGCTIALGSPNLRAIVFRD